MFGFAHSPSLVPPAVEEQEILKQPTSEGCFFAFSFDN